MSKLSLLPNAFSYGNTVNSLVTWLTNEGFVSYNRIARFINELTENQLWISESYISNLNLKVASNLTTAIQQIQYDVKDTNALHFDETNVKVNGTWQTVQSYANATTAYFHATHKKMWWKFIYFLHDYKKSLVVDYCPGYQILKSHTKIVGCNAHIERYLRLSTIDYQVHEAKQMLNLFTKLYIDKNKKTITNIEFIKKEYIHICDSYLEKYEKLNNIGKQYFSDSYLIFKRLKLKIHQHLAFITDHQILYSNNLIERDFRHVKTKMKVSGSFRDWNHFIAFTVVRSVLQTCKKRKMNIWQTINRIQNDGFSLW